MQRKNVFRKNVFIISPNYHGATLLSRLLSLHEEIMSLGDTYPRNDFDQICGCNSMVSQCDFWKKVQTAVGHQRYLDTELLMLPLYPRIISKKVDALLYNILSVKLLSWLITKKNKKVFREDFLAFQQAVKGDQTSDMIFIDGVKSISRVKALAACGLEIDGVIHLYRSPNDYIRSSLNKTSFTYVRFIYFSLNWRVMHFLASRLRSQFDCFNLSYESMANNSEAILKELFIFLGVKPKSLSYLVENNHESKPTWHFMGNESLFNFNGKIKQKTYDSGSLFGLAVRLLCGKYRFWQSVEPKPELS